MDFLKLNQVFGNLILYTTAALIYFKAAYGEILLFLLIFYNYLWISMFKETLKYAFLMISI